jgi:hypothetical protein
MLVFHSYLALQSLNFILYNGDFTHKITLNNGIMEIGVEIKISGFIVMRMATILTGWDQAEG